MTIRGISRALRAPATWVVLFSACGSQQPPSTGTAPAGPAAPRVLPLARVIVLETSGPPPSDTSVTFTAGTRRIIVLRHGPPENIVFARVGFAANSFGDSGQVVTVELRPRPGVYGLDISTSAPFRSGVTLGFEFARYFSAPALARRVYRSDAAFERALAVGRLLPESQIELQPAPDPQLDNVSAAIPASGSYLVAAPQ